MLRHVLSLVALSLVVSPVACKKKKDDAEGKAKTAQKDDDESSGKSKKAKKDDSEDEPEGDEPKKKGTKACKALPNSITADWTVPEGCKQTVKNQVFVREGATLTIEPGAKLSFQPGTSLVIETGKLVAKGTEDAPIVFTSANSSAAAGDWDGIAFEEKVTAGNVLDHVTVEYAGHEGGWTHGGVTIYGDVSPGRVTITNSTFQNNEHCGIHDEREKSKFAKLEGNTFKKNGGAAMKLHPEIVGSVGDNKLDEPIKVSSGTVSKSAKWPKAPAYVVEGQLKVEGSGQAAILTLPEKGVVKVTPGHYLVIGGGDGGGLVAKGVKFTSSNDSPNAGDWGGISFETKATNTVLEDCIIEYAGHDGGWGKGAVTFYGDPPEKAKGVKMKDCTFRHNEHGAIDPYNGKDCGKFADDNKSEGDPMCVKH